MTVLMDIREKQEKAFTHKRVLYSNNPKECHRPDSFLRQELNQRFQLKNIKLFPLPPKVNNETFTKFLFHNPAINKIHSTTLDVFETFPYRPDMSFDSMWRALEALMMRYAKDVLRVSGKDADTIKVLERICLEAILPILNSSGKIKTAINDLIGLIPESIGRFTLVRMLTDREIMIASQLGQVSGRTKKIIGEDLYDAFKNRYLTEGTITDENHYNGAKKMLRLVKGERLTFNGIEKAGLSEAKRYEFIISAILYTVRCERYHGDFFSPFYSDRASLKTYRHWYWLLTVTMTFFWIVLMKYNRHLGLDDITEQSMLSSIDYNITELVKL